MKFGESSPQQDPLAKMADKRAEEYFTKEMVEKLARFKETIAALGGKLGLKPGETLKDYLRISPSKEFVDVNATSNLDPEVASAIDDLFKAFDEVYQEGAPWDRMSKKNSKGT